MPNWTSITTQDLAGAKIGTILATAVGAGFDVNAAIANVVSRIRSAVSAGNTLDVDPTKIPNSLKDLAIRKIQLRVKGFLEMPLSKPEEIDAADDSSYTRRIIDEKLKFETPDNPAGSAEMQVSSPIEIASHGRRFDERELRGLM